MKFHHLVNQYKLKNIMNYYLESPILINIINIHVYTNKHSLYVYAKPYAFMKIDFQKRRLKIEKKISDHLHHGNQHINY